jgi:hypothetical protein
MKRITPEEVQRAYEATGLKPCRIWAEPTGGECCGIGAMAVAAHVAEHPMLWGDRQYGHQYRLGFTHGFDDYGQDWAQEDRDDESFMAGYADGLAAAQAVFQGS